MLELEQSPMMRLSVSIALRASLLAAAVCGCATLAPASRAAGATAGSEAANLFGPRTSTPAAHAASPARGAGSATATPAGKAAAQPALKLTPAQREKLLKEAQAKVKVSGSGGLKVPATTTTAATKETSSGVGSSMIFALIAAGLLLGGVAFVIVRDARSVAPVVEGASIGGTRNPEGRLRKRRAQAKAARAQRKRHRRR